MMYYCWSRSWTDLQSLSGSMSQWLCCLASLHGSKCLPKKGFSVLRGTEKNFMCMCTCSRGAVGPFVRESSPVSAAWNRCFPICMCELIDFCNILPLPWPIWRPCPLSDQQACIYSTFICTTLTWQKGNCHWLLTCECQFCRPWCNYIQSSRS